MGGGEHTTPADAAPVARAEMADVRRRAAVSGAPGTPRRWAAERAELAAIEARAAFEAERAAAGGQQSSSAQQEQPAEEPNARDAQTDEPSRFSFFFLFSPNLFWPCKIALAAVLAIGGCAKVGYLIEVAMEP